MRQLRTYLGNACAGVFACASIAYAQPVELPKTQPSSQNTQASPTQDAPKKISAVEGRTQIEYDHFGISLFYDPQSIRRLRAALQISEIVPTEQTSPAQKEGDLSFVQTPIMPKTIELKEYPVFHLASLVRSGPSKWVMWLNGKRTTPATLPDGLSVVSMATDRATFRWKPEAYPALSMRWGALEDDETQQAPKRIRSISTPVKVNKQTKEVTFSLRANQTYVSAFNQVVEGKIAPLSVRDGNGTVDVDLFEQVLRETEEFPKVVGAPILPKAGAQRIAPGEARVVRPRQTQPNQGQPTTAVPLSPKVVDAQPADQLPVIFPGGVPAATPVTQAAPTAQAQPEADLGLPILPQ